jgi:hypothetical protein
VQSGGSCVGWWDWQDATGSTTTVTAVPNRAGNGDFAKTSATDNPRTTMLGRQASSSTYDAGLNNAHMKALLTTNVPAGGRPFAWGISKLRAIDTGAGIRYTISGTNTAETFAVLGVNRNDVAGNRRTFVASGSPSSDVINTTTPLDLVPHLFGVGVTASATARAEMDGALSDGAISTVSSQALDRFLVHVNANSAFDGGVTADVAGVLCSSTEPTSGQRQWVRDYYRRKFFGLSIDPDSLLRMRLGSALLYWWEPRANLVALSGSNLTSLTALAGGVPLVTAAGTLPYVSSGGPAGREYIAVPLAGTNYAAADAMEIAAGNRTGFYCIGRFTDRSANRVVFATRIATGAGGVGFQCAVNGAGDVHSSCRFTTAGSKSCSIAGDSSWHTFSVHNPAAGAFGRIDGQVPAVLDAISGVTETLQVHATAQLGHPALTSGGDWASTMLVDMSADADQRHAAVQDYYIQRFGMAA